MAYLKGNTRIVPDNRPDPLWRSMREIAGFRPLVVFCSFPTEVLGFPYPTLERQEYEPQPFGSSNSQLSS